MNEMKVFTNSEFGAVRTVSIDGEPYFVGKDVAEILGYERSTKAVVDCVDEDDRRMIDGKTQSQIGIELGQRGGWLINESGLYSLILGSKLPSAKRFKHWVTSEVLPSIRKHSAYLTPEKVEEFLLNPDTIIRLATDLKNEREARIAAETKIREQAPKVAFAEAVERARENVHVAEMARSLNQKGRSISQNRLFALLRENRILMSGCYPGERNLPYQRYIDDGYFVVKENCFHNPYSGAEELSYTTLVTPRGQIWIANNIGRWLN